MNNQIFNTNTYIAKFSGFTSNIGTFVGIFPKYKIIKFPRISTVNPGDTWAKSKKAIDA